jgi:hypothetical protein
MMTIYFKQQQHDSLLQYLCHSIKEENKTHFYAQVKYCLFDTSNIFFSIIL